jgi:hypothetical protein
VSSIPSSNTIFQGRQIKRREDIYTEKRQDRDRIDTEEKQKRDQRRRSRKIQAAYPKKNQDRSETQRQRVIIHCKQRL